MKESSPNQKLDPISQSYIDPWCADIVLTGKNLRLEPLANHHLSDLERNLLHNGDWHWEHWGQNSREYIERAVLRSQIIRNEGNGNGFAMVIKATGEAVGFSRFMAFNRHHHFVEIGGTSISRLWQKTFVNTEAKYLMLKYAFEEMRCQRVEFRADALNFKSQLAILRIGAKYEGELRNACRLPDGRIRDYKVYSIIQAEWTNIEATLRWYRDSKYV